MRSAWMWFGLSVVCLVLGLILVLVFIVLFIVPSVTSSAVINTQCHVESVQIGNASLSDKNTSCPVVVVSFTMQDGRRRKGLLYKSAMRQREDVTDKKCYCDNCQLQSEETFGMHTRLSTSSVYTGGVVKCQYFVTSSGHPRMHSMVLLNVMLWPTLVFISGFVGIFFTCIHLAKDDCRFQQHSPSQAKNFEGF
ncbi:hypothetical protein CAPTEDRAFT_197463 [Capitella teleta]|uniref:Uncharacterized protein n=1 Tax=Capitella teleta TaxID=283909 RepID=R7TH52_CAPTE|nr:hypothetical protein CAPTEDRAFT_197463 [Capitella teleta]|eukprot:ELT90445.1 hypothetical protein CAPTEDRAFT_197463 [Capitella teleta]